MFKLSYHTQMTLVATVISISPTLQAGAAEVEEDAAAGFNCKKAHTQVEKMICDNSDLSGADGRLGKVYSQLQKSLSEAEKDRLKKEQLGWLKKRDAYLSEVCQGDVDCAVRFYDDRITELETKEPLGVSASDTSEDRKVYGEVITESSDLNIRQGMGTDTTVVGKVKKGTRIRILETLGPWYKVQLEDGKVGYASSEFIQLELPDNANSPASTPEEEPPPEEASPPEEETSSGDSEGSEETPAPVKKRALRSPTESGTPLEDGEAP